MEYPGFYFDPKTKKLYREPKKGWSRQHVNAEHEKERNKANISSFILPKSKGMVDLLQIRELGMRKNQNFESPYLKLKTEIDFRNNEDISSYCGEHTISDILIVKGGHQSIFALWKVRDVLEDVLGEIILDSGTSYPSVNFRKVMALGVQDFCDGFEDSEFLCVVSNCYRTQSGRLMVVTRHREHEIEPARLHMKKSSVFSCCSNSNVRQFAVGSEHSVGIENSIGSLYVIQVSGNAHSVQYNSKGNTLYVGINTGKLSIVDLRFPNSFTGLKLFEVGINELALLSNEHDIICGSFEGGLVRVDMRMEKVVAEYLNHSHSIKKSPVSLNESMNLLCATGVDNMTRLWSLNGGVPVQVIRPPEENEPHKAWLLGDSWNAKLLLFQKKQMYKFNI